VSYFESHREYLLFNCCFLSKGGKKFEWWVCCCWIINSVSRPVRPASGYGNWVFDIPIACGF
jgi:hypothetical protein